MNRVLLLFSLILLGITASAADKRVTVTTQAEDAAFSAARMKVIDHAPFLGKKGVMLADDAKATITAPDINKPDFTFTFDVKVPGRYWVVSRAATFGAAREFMGRASSKYDSFRIRLAIDDDFIRERVLISPWENQNCTGRELLRKDFSVGTHTIRVWIPEGCALDSLSLTPYNPPAIPAEARNYQPPVLPADAHPRIWATPETLPQIRANLNHPDHQEVWKQTQIEAARPIAYKAVTGAEAEFNSKLQTGAMNKAFVYLMNGDKKMGRQAIDLMTGYLNAVEFGNMLDITRELGSAIYVGALVYDWCYDLLTPAEEEIMRRNLLRLAEDMEIGWPPFRQSVVNGHGNEMQVNRDLLAMGLALYGKEFQPYQLCSWLILERLVPLRALEYVSNRHNQGVSYGLYRFGAEMHGAWMMRRMCGKEVYEPSIKSLGWYFLYYTRPDGGILPEGDGSLQNSLWSNGNTGFLIYSYGADPVFKGDCLRQPSAAVDNVLFLTLNDPKLPAASAKELANLPLTHYFGAPLPGMIARTGWDIGPNSNDAMISMQGGDLHFGNHQHMDAGNFQIYYRGMIVADLGIYGFYGTPYDMGFNKRSIAHSVMLLYDPADKHHRFNDGGMRMNQRHPVTVADTREPQYQLGEVQAAFIGPDKVRPIFSYLKNDLTPAYYGKAKDYRRSYCFVNLGMARYPGMLIAVDRVTPRDNTIREFWSVNTLTEPVPTDRGIVATSDRDVMPGKVTLSMFMPEKWEREIVGGKDGSVATVFGQKLLPPSLSMAQAKGYRTTFRPAKQGENDIYAAAMVISDDNAPELPVDFKRIGSRLIFSVAGRVVILDTADGGNRSAMTLELKEKSVVFMDGLDDGPWRAVANGKKRVFNAAADGTLVMELEAGVYLIAPDVAGTPAEAMPAVIAPVRPLPQPGLYLGSQLLDAPQPLQQGDVLMVPVQPLLDAMKAVVEETPQTLKVKCLDRVWEFTAGSKQIRINGNAVNMAEAPIVKDGVWYVQDYLLAAIGERVFDRDTASRNVMFGREPGDNGGLLTLESNCGMSLRDWREINNKGEVSKGSNYWAASGTNVVFTARMVDVRTLDAIGIAWNNGGARYAYFKLDVYDGSNWKTVYDGSSRKTNGVEYYTFPKQPVQAVRFTGRGNSANTWNSIIRFVLRDAK